MTQAWHDGSLYEGYMGRWSRIVAPRFLAWLDSPRELRWLDVGCGTGALTHAILATCAPEEVVGVDRSGGFVGWASEHVGDERAHFREGDAAALPVVSGQYDVVVSGLMLNFVPEPATALAEMQRALAPGGRVALYVWDYAEGMGWLRAFWDAAIAVNPAAAAGMDQGERYAICRPDALRALFSDADLGNVQVDAIDVAAHFESFDDYWGPFVAGGPYPAPTYLASRPPEEREAIRARLRTRLNFGADGSLDFNIRAWAVQGETRK